MPPYVRHRPNMMLPVLLGASWALRRLMRQAAGTAVIVVSGAISGSLKGFYIGWYVMLLIFDQYITRTWYINTATVTQHVRKTSEFRLHHRQFIPCTGCDNKENGQKDFLQDRRYKTQKASFSDRNVT